MNWRKLKFLMLFQNFAFTSLCKSQPQICSSQKPKIPSTEKTNHNTILHEDRLETTPQSTLRTLTATETTSTSHQPTMTTSEIQTLKLSSSSKTSSMSASLETTTANSRSETSSWPTWPVTSSLPFTSSTSLPTLDTTVLSTTTSSTTRKFCRPRPPVINRGPWIVANLPQRPPCKDEPSENNTTTENVITTENIITTEPQVNTNLTTTEVEAIENRNSTPKFEDEEEQMILSDEKEIVFDSEFDQKPSSNSTSGEKHVETSHVTSVTTTNGFRRNFLRNYTAFMLVFILSMP